MVKIWLTTNENKDLKVLLIGLLVELQDWKWFLSLKGWKYHRQMSCAHSER